MGDSRQSLSSIERSLDCSEESGWTIYFDDFFSNNRERSDCSSEFGSTSLVSDAASCVRLKAHKLKLGHERSLSFKSKKRRTRHTSFDDDLEDTASSPLNSPKVSQFSKLAINPRSIDGNSNTFQRGLETIHASEENRRKLGFNIEEGNEYTELKKRGLCLVPLSMLVNYAG